MFVCMFFLLRLKQGLSQNARRSCGAWCDETFAREYEPCVRFLFNKRKHTVVSLVSLKGRSRRRAGIEIHTVSLPGTQAN